jgi:hypothetical protein
MNHHPLMRLCDNSRNRQSSAGLGSQQEKIMPTLTTLKRKARKAATQRGHALSHFSKNGDKTSACAQCTTCKAMAVVRTVLLPNEIDLSGKALAIECNTTTQENTMSNEDKKVPTLVYTRTQKPVKIGDRVKIHGGDIVTVSYFREPHSPASEGKVTVMFDGARNGMEYYVSVIGAEWINRTDRD